MKIFLNLLFAFVLTITCSLKANSMDFEEAFRQVDKKPMLVLIYADWVDNSKSYVKEFRELEKEFGNTYNFVELDIASKDMKYFNSMYYLYPNLPYLLMFRNAGKISRYIDRNCILDPACSIPKIRSFIL